MTLQIHRIALIPLLIASAPSAVHAQPSDDPDALIDEGLQLRREGRDADALERFQRAYQLRPTGRALAQVALAEQASGLMVDAHEHLTEVLAGADDPWVTEHRAELSQALATIRALLGHLTLTGGVEGAEVRIDGTARATLPLSEPMWVPAGELVVEVRAEGYHPFTRRVRVEPGGRARAAVHLVALPSAPAVTVRPEPPTPSAPAGSPLPIVGGVVLAAAGAALAVGIAFHVVREDAAAHYNGDACVAAGQPRAVVCADTLAEVGDAEIAMGVGYAGAAAFAVLGAVLIAVGVASDGESHAWGCGGSHGPGCGARF